MSLFKGARHSDYHRVYTNNMDDESFIKASEGLPKISKVAESAFLQTKGLSMFSEAYKKCKIEFVPWEEKLGSISMPITKL